ncbi:MAG: ferrous iron transport protein B [Aquificaceae bacterium]
MDLPKIALLGNPNVGKTSILNELVGARLKVGNWPGVTLEKREGKFEIDSQEVYLVDLPGIYTLYSNGEEEGIVKNYIFSEKPQLLVNVIETANLERDLFLTLDLISLNTPMILVLNMSDEAKALGVEVDIQKLKDITGLPAVKTSAKTGEGISQLKKTIKEALKNQPLPNKNLVISSQNLSKPELEALRSNQIKSILGEVYKTNPPKNTLTDRLDAILIHPVYGLFVFLAVMFLMFKLAFDFSSPFMDWLDGFFNSFLSPLVGLLLGALPVSEWFIKLIQEAIIGGVGFVLTFVPLIAISYTFIVFLELSGYLPRASFLMDRYVQALGLNGKSLIPLLLGFGCNVPAILSVRLLERERDRLLTMAMIPFMSCPARLVVFAFFASIFFKNPAVVIFGLYIFGVLMAVLTALILGFFIKTSEKSYFLMELPPYRLPSFNLLFRIVWVYVRDFIYKAGTFIFASAIVVWALTNLPPNREQSQTIAAQIGRAISPVFEPLGLGDWRMSTSLVPALLAREIVLSSMATIYSPSLQQQENEEFKILPAIKDQLLSLAQAFPTAILNTLKPSSSAFEANSDLEPSLKKEISKHISAPSALSFMVFLLIYTSCLGTLGVLWRQAGPKYTLGLFAYTTILAWILAFITYRLSSLIIS